MISHYAGEIIIIIIIIESTISRQHKPGESMADLIQ